MFGSAKKKKQNSITEGKHKSPLDELNFLLDRLEGIIFHTKLSYIKSLLGYAEEIATPQRSSVNLFGRKSNSSTSTPTKASLKKNDSASSPNFKTPEKTKDGDAMFIPMESDSVQNTVEIIRRVSELVVFAESAAASQTEEKQESEKYIAVFDSFFERNGLALITDILTGASFDLRTIRDEERVNVDSDQSPKKNDLASIEELLEGFDMDEHKYLLLPPLPIAIQAIQSVSILVQNVKRATSLFFILSNNHITQLINAPLEKYDIADRMKRDDDGNQMSPRRSGSQELAELSTNFVNFLKSLALRMNAETLQFFLTYPQDAAENPEATTLQESKNSEDSTEQDAEDKPLDEMEGTTTQEEEEDQVETEAQNIPYERIRVEFPLYERALEFCSTHNDSFIRITAMNICLNTLRLSVVGSEEDDGQNQDSSLESPDGVLHNARALPMRERLAIAQFVCSPRRVERLISPIFTKLAQFWGVMEEQYRELDKIKVQRLPKPSDDANASGQLKTEKAKLSAKRKKAEDSFSDTAACVQDELLLLEDVLSVGLTTLNEQTIEMMFATFVYPLLLQPLLLYFQRSTVPSNVLYADPVFLSYLGLGVADSSTEGGENSTISAPAKSALFLLTAVFQFVTNRPLLKLLFTALFHPLSPSSTGETTIRVDPEIVCLDKDRNIVLRVDLQNDDSQEAKINRETYDFGISSATKRSSGKSRSIENSSDSCVFVLSPALAEILRFNGEDGALVAKSRNNPYRKAIFQCFALSSELSDLSPLAVFPVDAAFSALDGEFVSDIVFGVDVVAHAKKHQSYGALSEKQIDRLDDRDIGGAGIGVKSRFSLGDDSDGDYVTQVLSSFQKCLAKARPGAKGTWKLDYRVAAAHAVLCAIQRNPVAQKNAKEVFCTRYREASAFLASIPKGLERFGDSNLRPTYDKTNGEDDKRKAYQGILMNRIFRGDAQSVALMDQLMRLKSESSSSMFVPVASRGSYKMLCKQSCQFPLLEPGTFNAALQEAVESARSWASMDAFCKILESAERTNGASIRRAVTGGIAVKEDSGIVPTYRLNLSYGPMSRSMEIPMFQEDTSSKSYTDAEPGSVVSLVGRTAFPCVCEVPPACAPLFSAEGAKVVSQGITWQSLYLVVLGWNLVLAEPERKSSGNGRVVMVCRLENLSVGVDTGEFPQSTAARRLIVSHDGQDETPPGLFMFESPPTRREEGVFVHLSKFRTTLDIWFENQKALDLAFVKVKRFIALAKAHRGHLLQEYLLQQAKEGADMVQEK
ncbi:unnamed protein product [Cylindrotheca closterium]|uniref:FPL domain-containing protein n=1 Tax=Cylindrotheca closterium TaxID=2856 RepID=A0AAD2GAD1_9STRA|nr:unnamed protein product [Cylindrotheca closterium]